MEADVAQFKIRAHILRMNGQLRALVAIALSCCASACDQNRPVVFDEDIELLRGEFPGIKEGCLVAMQLNGSRDLISQTDQCFRMTPSQRWAGIYVDGFENQLFCPTVMDRCEFDPAGDRIWTTFRVDRPRPTAIPTEQKYVVEFIGRRTLLPGQHGHLGSFNHEIIVDELVSTVPIDGAP